MQLSKIAKLNKLPQYLLKLRADIDILQAENKELKQSIGHLAQTNNELSKRIIELEHVINVLQVSKQKVPAAAAKSKDNQVRFADNHLLDNFYLWFETHFRGSEAEVQQRQKPHLALYQKSKVNYTKFPAVDLGAGRGEFVNLLNKNKIRTIGVDLNEAMVKQIQQKGHEAVQADALSYLIKEQADSIGAISGFHLAEHVPVEQLLMLLSEAQRTLVPGGFLLLQTPNPENLMVGAFTFHFDPSHLKPLPPAILDGMAKFKGFTKVNILRLEPEMTEQQIKSASSNRHIQSVLRLLHGPRDYALLAYK